MDSDTINFTETFPQSMQEALKASLKVFWRLGVHRASIDDVCRQSGVSYHFLNENFESKEHLYRTAVMWYLDQYGRQLLSEFALHSNPTEALRGALYECIGLFCNKQCEHAKLLSYALAAVNNSDRILISELSPRVLDPMSLRNSIPKSWLFSSSRPVMASIEQHFTISLMPALNDWRANLSYTNVCEQKDQHKWTGKPQCQPTFLSEDC